MLFTFHFLMNYATLLALLAALSFGLPLLVQLGEGAGVSRGSGIALTLAITLFVLIWLLLRRPLKKQAQQHEVQTKDQKND
jgi:threonine/homoserine/homoserine lactone efflux protein